MLIRVRVLLVFLLCILYVGDLEARGGAVSVRGYYRSNGTYVAPHMRSAPDGNFYNNWSTVGNVNPYTGKEGTKTAPSDSGQVRAAPLDTSPIQQQYSSPSNSEVDNQPVQPVPYIQNSISPTISTSNNSIQMPPNSKLDYTGHNWVCNFGFKQNANTCDPIQLPVNAKVDYTGHSWVCDYGFKQNAGSCEAVTMPQNAKVDYTGHNWVCDYGFKQNAGSCEAVAMPPNAKIDYTGHNWVCEYGFKQNANSCDPVTLPPNAKIDYTGHNWVCETGFKQDRNGCDPIQLPNNSKVDYTGHNWVCDYGFKQYGNECVPLNPAH